MTALTAAQNARTRAALDKPLVTDDYDASSWRERLTRGDFGARVKRTLSSGVTRYGLILAEDADAGHMIYYPCPKLVFDYAAQLPNVGEA